MAHNIFDCYARACQGCMINSWNFNGFTHDGASCWDMIVSFLSSDTANELV